MNKLGTDNSSRQKTIDRASNDRPAKEATNNTKNDRKNDRKKEAQELGQRILNGRNSKEEMTMGR